MSSHSVSTVAAPWLIARVNPTLSWFRMTVAPNFSTISALSSVEALSTRPGSAPRRPYVVEQG
ncbi:hypothetical protein [Nocardia pneumoniae]|uniref:hypothetical protein n=1 Tax=Nocardia pneumoniae TaxID=228601 RepID=UPI001FDFC604|nr:hypothetical protein [Nocardia pneumoniae]